MEIRKYQGIIPALYACYDRNGDVSPKAVRALSRYLANKGVKGLYVGGSSGECIVVNDHDLAISTEPQEGEKGKI